MRNPLRALERWVHAQAAFRLDGIRKGMHPIQAIDVRSRSPGNHRWTVFLVAEGAILGGVETSNVDADTLR